MKALGSIGQVCFFLYFFLSFHLLKAEPTLKEDAFTLYEATKQGIVEQFTHPYALGVLSASLPLLGYTFVYDKKITHTIQQRPKEPAVKLSEIPALIAASPLISMGSYIIGRSYDNKKAVRFALDLFGTTTTVLLQTAVMSFIPIHERPVSHKLNFFEKYFRGDSSFPSGHVSALTCLTYKTFQYFGPIYGGIASFVTLVSAYERINSEKHWASDTIGAATLSIMAGIGFQKAFQKIDGENVAGNNWNLYPVISQKEMSLRFQMSFF